MLVNVVVDATLKAHLTDLVSALITANRVMSEVRYVSCAAVFYTRGKLAH